MAEGAASEDLPEWEGASMPGRSPPDQPPEDGELPDLTDAVRDWIRSQDWLDEQTLAGCYAGLADLPVGASPIPYLLGDGHIDAEQAAELAEVQLLAETVPEFILRRRLGAGAVGSVYLAEDRETGGEVALKIMHRDIAGLEVHRARFEREAETLRDIEHPVIPRLIAHSGCRKVGDLWGSGELHDAPAFIAMEFVHGVTLRELLQRFGNLPEKFALRVIAQCARAMHHIAERGGMIHRDLKPANLLVVDPDDLDGDAEWSVKIIDFGLAKSGRLDSDGHYSAVLLEPVTGTGSVTTRLGCELDGTVVGTPHYMAPEQIRGAELDWRTDCYALGATLFHLVTGRTPYAGGSPGKILMQHIVAETPDPRSVNPTLDERTARICQRAMSKEAERRFPSMLAFAEACDRAIAHLDLPSSARHGTVSAARGRAVSASQRPAVVADRAPSGRRSSVTSGAAALPGADGRIPTRTFSGRLVKPAPGTGRASRAELPVPPPRPGIGWRPLLIVAASLVTLLLIWLLRDLL